MAASRDYERRALSEGGAKLGGVVRAGGGAWGRIGRRGRRRRGRDPWDRPGNLLPGPPGSDTPGHRSTPTAAVTQGTTDCSEFPGTNTSGH